MQESTFYRDTVENKYESKNYQLLQLIHNFCPKN